MPVYLVGDEKSMVLSKRPAMLLVWRDVNINAFDLIDEIFWKFKFHLKYFPRTVRFLDFYRVSDYLHFFKKQPA